MATIVVGVDGSAGSVEALHFAISEARRSKATIKTVAAWHIPPLAYGAGWSVPVDTESFRISAEANLAKTLEHAGVVDCGVEVTSEVKLGQPAEVLCAEAEGADLLVVGSRGLGGFRGLVLGSVSQQCAHHTPCPIVIVPSKQDAPGSESV